MRHARPDYERFQDAWQNTHDSKTPDLPTEEDAS
jgi:hypothetical protein